MHLDVFYAGVRPLHCYASGLLPPMPIGCFVELDVRQVPKCASPASAASIKAPNAAATWRHGDSSMIDNERWIRITVHGAPHFAWVEVKANSVQLARALPQAPYGRENAIKVQQKRRR